MLTELNITEQPLPKIAGSTGCGEGVAYDGKTFFYRVGKKIPREKVVLLKWEGHFAHRQHGDKEYLIVYYDQEGKLLLLENLWQSPMEVMKKFKGLTNKQAIELIVSHKENLSQLISKLDKCGTCGNVVILLEDDQPEDLCYSCYKTINK